MHIINGDAPGQSAPGRSKSGFQKEKSTWLLDTAEADYEETSAHSLPTAEKIINDEPKDYATMRAQFAKRGHVLTRSRRVPCGRITFTVTRWGMHRTFASMPDLQRYLHQVTEAAI
jgi:hypothetical protein